MTEHSLALRGVSKHFGAVEALTGVDFTVRSGEVVALVGDNGAGKSTLIKVISGVLTPDAGEIAFDGRPVTLSGPADAAALGVATVYQDLALCDNLDVVSNLYLGQERHRSGVGRVLRWLDETAMEQRSVELLSRLSVRLPSVRTPVATLSGGQRQSVAIARSLLGDPAIVLLDEPTAALGVAQTEEVLRLIRDLRDHGHGLVVISHNLQDVFAVADRIVVLRLGRNAGELAAAETSHSEVVSAITGARAAR